jgi:ketosteroid isomerase-like protein
MSLEGAMVREAWEQGTVDEGEEARTAVDALVAAINSGHAERIVGAMGGEPVFIDSLGTRIKGRQPILAAWRAYLRMFPDYRIEVDAMFPRGREVMLHGRAGGTLHRDGRAVESGRWEILAAWRAQTDSRRVLVWQVFADNKPVYALLGG